MAWLMHVLGMDSGSGTAYLFWSGFGSDLGELTIVGALLAVYRKHSCHTRHCWRIGRYKLNVKGVGYSLCRRHHPAHPGPPEAAARAVEEIRDEQAPGAR